MGANKAYNTSTRMLHRPTSRANERRGNNPSQLMPQQEEGESLPHRFSRNYQCFLIRETMQEQTLDMEIV